VGRWLAHLAAVIDCHGREAIDYKFALRSRAKEAERAMEAACLKQFGTLRLLEAPFFLSDNGLIFQRPVQLDLSLPQSDSGLRP
jgi:putative transposase